MTWRVNNPVVTVRNMRAALSNGSTLASESEGSRAGRFIVRWRFVIIGMWLLLAGGLNLFVPQIESVIANRSMAFIPPSAPSLQAMSEIGPNFGEPGSSGMAYFVLERDSGLTDADHRYYDAVLANARSDRANVAMVQDLWSSPDTAQSVVSKDGKAVYALIRLRADTGTTDAATAVGSLRSHAGSVDKPAGLAAEVTGIGPTVVDEFDGIHHSLTIITGITVLLIAALLLAVYRSLVVAGIALTTIGLGLAVARPLVALMGLNGVPISIFSLALLSALILGAGTDYAVFLISRFHEERNAGHGSRTAFQRCYRRISTVVLGSAAIVALSAAIMSFAKIGIFRATGLPSSVGVAVVAAAALTLTPALLSVASDLRLAEPKSRAATDYWRRIAAAAVGRPVRSLAASLALVALLAAIAPTLVLSYDERATQPASTPSNRGYALAAEHYDGNELTPTFLAIRSDHDMRTSADLGAIEKITAAVAQVPGVISARGVSRPLGQTIPESAVGYQAGLVGDRLDAGVAELAAAQPRLTQLTDGSAQFFDGVRQLAGGTGQLAEGGRQAAAGSGQLVDGGRRLDNGLGQLSAGALQLSAGTRQAREGATALSSGIDTATAPMADLLNRLQPLRDLVTNTANCDDDALCAAARSALGAVDQSAINELIRLRDGARALAAGSTQIDTGAQDLLSGAQQSKDGSGALVAGLLALDGGLQTLNNGVQQADAGSRRLVDGIPPLQDGINQVTGGMSALFPGLREASGPLAELRRNAGASANGGFYLPQSSLSDARMKSAVQLFFSPDGRTTRVVITDSGDPFSSEANERGHAILDAARRATGDTSLSGARIDAFGSTVATADLRSMVSGDLAMIIIASCLVCFCVLVLILRSLVAPFYIVATGVASYVAALGLSTLVWQHLLHIELHWAVPSMSFIAMMALGADYNLLLMSRVREELVGDPAGGTRAAVVRAVSGTGGVITVAGVIFAITMFALLSSSVTSIGQVGFTIATGLLIDAMIVRTALIPGLAVLLGRANWWPRHIVAEKKSSAT
ncbi:RND family transporter [Nocardia sp. BMG51109]|uniref:MMPL/RND family transporter n=1 Tax=Nocardia sp. BMG51109 TaxID=1056816 RepID=UPI000464962F|nr:RND family transporter [Nocardia sp. BMG51109]